MSLGDSEVVVEMSAGEANQSASEETMVTANTESSDISQPPASITSSDTSSASQPKAISEPAADGSNRENTAPGEADTTSSTRPTARSGANKRSASAETRKTDHGGKPAAARADSLSRKEREEKVREARERMEKENQKKLQELLEAQKTDMFATALSNVAATVGESGRANGHQWTVEEEATEDLRLKQQEIRRKRLEDLKSKDGERQRAAEERRKRRELEEEERKRNFMKKRLDRAQKADHDARLKKGRHESYGFGSSAPRFEDIILTSSPGTRSLSQLNLSAVRKSAASGDEADQDWPSHVDFMFDGGSRPTSPIYVVRRQDSPRPGSATPGDGMSPRNNTSDSSAMYIARPLSKSITNISNHGVRRTPDSSSRQRRVSAGASSHSGSGGDHSLQQSRQRRPRISFSPVTLISSPPGGSTSRAKSSERKPTAALLSPAADRLSRSSTRLASKTGAKSGGAVVTRARSTDLPDNLKKSVARLSVARTPQPEQTEKNKPKPTISASHSNLSTISKHGSRRSPPIEPIKIRHEATKTSMGSRSMTTGDIHKLGLSRGSSRSSDSKKQSVSTDRKTAATKPKSSVDVSSKADANSSTTTKSSVKARSSSATRTNLLTKSTDESSFESRSKTLDRPSKAQRAAKAEAMSKSMYASTSLASTSSGSDAGRMRKARSVGNISKAHLSTAKKEDVAKPAPSRSALAKSKSTDPVRTPKKATPVKAASSKPSTPASKASTPSAKTTTPSGSKPSSKSATPGGSRRSSKDANTVSPKGTRSTTPTVESDSKGQDEATPEAGDSASAAAEVVPPAQPEKPKETSAAASSSAVAKEDTKKSVKAAEMEEYKAKLAEKRREAREKAEREAEEERQRQEAARLAEEERQREEEEKQRLFEIEQDRLAAEARQLEQERLEKAIEEEEKRRREESERLEQERIAKEEAAEKARLEAERKEKERQEKIAKEELEKLERKKKLEMIMKRVKTGSPTPDRPQPASEPASMNSSMTGSMTSSSPSAASSFKSPLLQGLMGSKASSDNLSEKKFSSPLLNNIMAKVSADRSEDNSSNSSTSSTPPSHPNSAETSPEHKTLPAEESPSGEDDSQLSVELDAEQGTFSVSLGGDDSPPLEDSAIASAELNNMAANDSGVHVDTLNTNNANNLNGMSQKTLADNSDSNSTQNGVTHSPQINGKSAGVDSERQETFEEVLTLTNKQTDSSANPAPLIAFDDHPTAHTEEVH